MNLNSTEGGDVSVATTFTTNPGNIVQDAPAVNAATAGSVSVNISGNIVEGDSFTVGIGNTTATYVAGANET